MTNRQLSKITTLHQEGVSIEVCLAIIMDLTYHLSSLEKGTWVHKFYEAITKKEN